MKNWEEKIIKNIKKGKIKQEPKWLYLIKKSLLWLSFIITTFLSTFAFAYFLRDVTDTFGKMHEIKIQSSFFLSNLFWIWGIIFIIFIIVSLWNFKKTKNGFRYENYKIVLFSLLVSILLGTLLYNFQLKKKLNNQYQHINNKIYIKNQ